MSNMRIMWRNFLDDAVLTTDADVAGNNVLANLQDASRSVWRTLGQPTSVSIFGHWNGMRFPVSWFLINRHNFPAHSTIRVRLFTTADWSGAAAEDHTFAPYAFLRAPFEDGGPLLNFGHVLCPTDFTASGIDYYSQLNVTVFKFGSFIITISASTVCQTDYWQAQRIYLGSYGEVPINPQLGATVGWQSGTVQTRLRDGSLVSDPGYVNRKFAGKMVLNNDGSDSKYFDGLNTKWNGAQTITTAVTYREELMRMLRRAELSRDVLVSFMPGYDTSNVGHLERDNTMAAKLTVMPELAWQGPLRWELPFTLEET